MPKLRKHTRDGYYYVDARDLGAGRPSLKTTDKRVARELYQDWLIRFGGTPAEVRQRITLGQAITAYLRDKRLHVTGEYLELIAGQLRHLTATLGDKRPVHQIRHKDLLDHIATRLEKIQRSTANGEIITIRALFRWLIGRHLLQVSPAANLKTLKVARTEAHFLTHDQCQRLIAASEPPFNDIWTTFLLTGLRKAELQDLAVRDLNLTTQRLRVAEGKGQKALPDRPHQLGW